MDSSPNSLSPYETREDDFASIHDTLLTLHSDAEVELFLRHVETRLRVPGSGFSLVELSIVLVILGLLVGGVLSGQSLIHAAELRTVIRDQQRFFAATNSFRDKYFALPGDMPNATSFWGAAAACPGDSSTATGGTCNGDGDGQITIAATTTNPGNEGLRYWQHLALAGLIEGTYSGTADQISASRNTINAGVNLPKSRITNMSWQMIYSPQNGPGYANNQNILFWNGSGTGLFLATAYWQNWWPAGGMKPEDAWNIDTKIDDGKPATGSVNTMPNDGPSLTGGNCHYPYDLASDPQYSLNVTASTCDLVFKFGN